MKFVIRADSGIEIGTGHVMRCLTLANKLRSEGHQVLFLAKPHSGHISHVVSEQGFPVVHLDMDLKENSSLLDHSHWLGGSQSDDAAQSIQLMVDHFDGIPDWIVVDHYGIDQHWESKFSREGIKIFVVDDLADRSHDCDILLDQNLGRTIKDYNDLVPQRCSLKLGVEYALLRDDFMMDQEALIAHRQKSISEGAGKILVMMGGTDHLDYTSKVLEYIDKIDTIDKVTVLLGPTANHYMKVNNYCSSRPGYSCMIGASNVASIMLEHDICIGAAGTSSWERCACGLPTLVTVIAENQHLAANALVEKNAAKKIDLSKESDALQKCLKEMQNPKFYIDSVKSCLNICNGRGVEKILKTISGF